MLKFKTDSIDTISIQWADVVYLTSTQTLQIEMGLTAPTGSTFRAISR